MGLVPYNAGNKYDSWNNALHLHDVFLIARSWSLASEVTGVCQLTTLVNEYKFLSLYVLMCCNFSIIPLLITCTTPSGWWNILCNFPDMLHNLYNGFWLHSNIMYSIWRSCIPLIFSQNMFCKLLGTIWLILQTSYLSHAGTKRKFATNNETRQFQAFPIQSNPWDRGRDLESAKVPTGNVWFSWAPKLIPSTNRNSWLTNLFTHINGRG